MFYEILKNTMQEPELELRAIEIKQERFDSELYQHRNGQHFWHGSYIKVDAVIESLEKADSEYILFSDIDILIQPGIYQTCKKYMDEQYDMVYLREGDICNIGFMLLRTNGEALAFWKNVRTSMEAEMDLDQKYVNKLIQSFAGKWTWFDTGDMLCYNEWNGQSHYKVVQLLCSNRGKEFNMAEKVVYMSKHMELSNYMQYLSEDVLSYVYSFQDKLIEESTR